MKTSGEPQHRERIRSLGQALSAELAAEMRAAYAPLMHVPGQGVRVLRDVAYGEHPRHRVNLFLPSNSGDAQVDILLFVHGGGFTGGDKEETPGAFFDNVGLWAASQHLIGATINYRLAPEHSWPAGVEDVARAVAWLHASIGQYGGNAQRIFVMGHSAGAAHVAGYVASLRHDGSIAGAICVSGIYDLSIPPVNPAYFGADVSAHAARSPLPGLVASPVPFKALYAEFDPAFVQQNVLSLANAWFSARGSLPDIAQVKGHNHFSVLFHLGSADSTLADEIRKYISSN